MEKDTQKEKTDNLNLEKYEDLEGVTLKKLNFGLWYVANRRYFYYALIGFLVIVGIATWTNFIYNYGYYIFKGINEDRLLASQIANQDRTALDFLHQTSPKELIMESPMSFKINGKFDYLIKISNPNPNHWARIKYSFISGDNEIRGDNFILPGESKPITSLANEQEGGSGEIRFNLTDIKWSKIDRHQIANTSDFLTKHLNIPITAVEYLSPKTSGLSEKLDLNQLKFTAANNTAYNYWEANFIILFSGNYGLAGVLNYSLSEFMSGQERPVAISWPGQMPEITKVEIFPEINIMEQGNYIKPLGAEEK